MSKLDNLIAELCPNGVSFASAQDLVLLNNYKQVGAGELERMIVDGGNIPLLPSSRNYDWYTTKEVAGKFLSKGEVFVIGRARHANTKYAKGFFVSSNNIIIESKNTEKIKTRFLYHYLTSIIANFYVETSTYPKFDLNLFKNLMIPVPPLKVQCEIVRILDTFVELTAELTARKKQYEYYRDLLLTFDNVEFKKLGELFEFHNGLNKEKDFFGRGTPFVRYTDVYSKRALRRDDIKAFVECTPYERSNLKVMRGDVLFTRTSETAEDVGWSAVMLDDLDECVFNGFTIRARPKTNLLLPEYCAFCFFTDEFRTFVTRNCAFTTRASLTGNTLARYRLPVPPLEEQERIVKILDRFDKLCNDISEGLPAEIEARKQQYEFYRDRLLSFDRIENHAIR